MQDTLGAHRVRIIREIETQAMAERTGRLPWRESWAAYFGSREGLLEALATRRRCLALVRLETLPGPRDHNAAWRLRKADAALERLLRHNGALDAPLAESA